jgi:uronate dehydrogenase
VRVLVTGATGRIGSAFAAGSTDGDLDLVLADIRPPAATPWPFVALDVTDRAALGAAVRGVDAVLHLAADPSPDADFHTSVVPVNMLATYDLTRAAVDAGVRRFVFASSAQAVAGYPLDHQVRESDPPRPANDYGVGKAFGEALCASLATRATTTFVSVRIGYYHEHRPDATASLRDRMAWLSPRDAVQLLTRTLTAPIAGHVVVHGISDNAAKQLSIDATRRVLGYAPRDDAFAG